MKPSGELSALQVDSFFPGTLDLKDLVIKLAASEAVFGLFIEVSFIATFTQRYFGK